MNCTCEGSRWRVPYVSCPDTIGTHPSPWESCLQNQPLVPGARGLLFSRQDNPGLQDTETLIHV